MKKCVFLLVLLSASVCSFGQFNTRIADQSSVIGVSKQTVTATPNGNYVYLSEDVNIPGNMVITEVDAGTGLPINANSVGSTGPIHPVAVIVEPGTNNFIVVGNHDDALPVPPPNFPTVGSTQILPFVARFDANLNLLSLNVMFLGTANPFNYPSPISKRAVAIQPTHVRDNYAILSSVEDATHYYLSLSIFNINNATSWERVVDEPNGNLYPFALSYVNNQREFVISGKNGASDPFTIGFDAITPLSLTISNDLVFYNTSGVASISNIIDNPNTGNTTVFFSFTTDDVATPSPMPPYTCNPGSSVATLELAIPSGGGYTNVLNGFIATPINAFHVFGNLEIAMNNNQNVVLGFTEDNFQCSGQVNPALLTLDANLQGLVSYHVYSRLDNEIDARFLSFDSPNGNGSRFALHTSDNSGGVNQTKIILTDAVGDADCEEKSDVFTDQRNYPATVIPFLTDAQEIYILETNPSDNFYMPNAVQCNFYRMQVGESQAQLASPLSPNPTSHELTLDCSQLKSWAKGINIVDMSGKTVLSYPMGEAEVMQLNVADLAAGLYQVLIQGNGKQETHRFVKE